MKGIPVYCIECRKEFTDDTRFVGRLCPECSRITAEEYENLTGEAKEEMSVKYGSHAPPDHTAKNKRSGVVNTLAALGYYARPVQTIVTKWSDRIDGSLMEEYFRRIAPALLGKGPRMDISIDAFHWSFVREIADALQKVIANKKGKTYWLLTTPEITVRKGGEWLSWDEIGLLIANRNGPNHSAKSWSQEASRLQF